MVTNGGDTEGLFRGAFMQSGAVTPNGDVSLGQQDYDDLVRAAGCAGAEDTLECLRQIPFSVLKEAVDMSQGFYSYRVRHDFSSIQGAQLRTVFCSRRTLPGFQGRMGCSSKLYHNSWYYGAASPISPSSQVAIVPKLLVCFPVDLLIRPLQVTATTKELFSPYPALTLREEIS